MARPRVFVSSTYYDLKHLRSAIEGFVEGLGFEAVLSEKGSIAYAPDVELDESCYREAQQADIMVLIVGSRYGSERSGENKNDSEFFTRYDSITKQEFRSAIQSNVPLYILIERAVYTEFHTFLKNRDSTSITYAHVQNVNIFMMIEEILSLPKNNPVFAFERYHEIEDWLREQWAGLFRELLRRRSSQEQLAALGSQVAQLADTNETLKRYLESLMTKVVPGSDSLIDRETQRLNESSQLNQLGKNRFVKWAEGRGVPLPVIAAALQRATSTEDLLVMLSDYLPNDGKGSGYSFRDMLHRMQSRGSVQVQKDIDEVRGNLGLPPLLPVALQSATSLDQTAAMKTSLGSEQSFPSDTVAPVTVPSKTIPPETIPETTASKRTASKRTASKRTAPKKTAPKKTAPKKKSRP